MEHTKLEAFHIIGITVRTTNEDNKAATDIAALWQKFMGEGIIDKVPNKVDTSVYSVYTDYESDHTKPYTTLLGCRVSNLDNIPEGMTGKTIETANYAKFVTRGDLTKGLIYEEWLNIWKIDLDRDYTADFEIYGEKAQNPMDAAVDIYIALK